MIQNISKHLDKNNLHHAYLIEGLKEEIIPEILEFIKNLEVEILGNPDFCHFSFDSFKVEDARNLKYQSAEKGISGKKNAKKIFLISANSFLLEAQNILLKMFEEPIENTHFFIIVPDANALLQTFVSRFYLISPRQDLRNFSDVEKFIASPLRNRIDFIKELLIEPESEEDGVLLINSTRSKAIKFLNALEFTLHNKIFKNKINTDLNFFYQIFKAREFLRQPGSSTKSLMEAIALNIPN